MRRALIALLLAGSLLAAPALAKGPDASLPAQLGRDFTTGAVYYVHTLGSWFTTLFHLIGLKTPDVTTTLPKGCDEGTRCATGTLCTNVCAAPGCASMEKQCLAGRIHVDVVGEYGECDASDLCGDATLCTRTCLPGMTCPGTGYRCLKPTALGPSCATDGECAATCAGEPFPPLGNTGYAASCSKGSCVCQPFIFEPNAMRVACPPATAGTLICPTGTHQECTAGTCTGTDCPAVLTCLAGAEYGGACLTDQECALASCPEKTSPFCSTDHSCKCRSAGATTVSCTTSAQCGSVTCGSGEIVACVKGLCACANPGPIVNACKSVADCSADCPSGYAPGCEKNACVCQRKTTAPVRCATVADCGAVSCPAGYDMSCRESLCACVRTVEQP